jgi:hypothetical protein
MMMMMMMSLPTAVAVHSTSVPWDAQVVCALQAFDLIHRARIQRSIAHVTAHDRKRRRRHSQCPAGGLEAAISVYTALSGFHREDDVRRGLAGLQCGGHGAL